MSSASTRISRNGFSLETSSSFLTPVEPIQKSQRCSTRYFLESREFLLGFVFRLTRLPLGDIVFFSHLAKPLILKERLPRGELPLRVNGLILERDNR